MICKNCGQQNDNDALFCTKCGAKQETDGLSEELKDVLIEVVPEDSILSEEGEQKGLEAECLENEDEPILEQETLEKEILSHYPSDVFSNEFEYTKKIFNRYYNAEFNARSLGAYIALQIVTLMSFVFPGILFAIIYWACLRRL
jgi:RNA polymerase subunit RPABC4/transcription elongation factor Spt4